MKHDIQILWQNNGDDMAYDRYSRDHSWHFGNGVQVPVSAGPGFLGNPECINPEQGVIASVASCHMLTALAIAAKKKWVISHYEDHPDGELGKTADGKTAIVQVTLRPKIRFAGTAPSSEEICKLHDSAHHHCFVANTLNCPVHVKPVITAGH